MGQHGTAWCTAGTVRGRLGEPQSSGMQRMGAGRCWTGVIGGPTLVPLVCMGMHAAWLAGGRSPPWYPPCRQPSMAWPGPATPARAPRVMEGMGGGVECVACGASRRMHVRRGCAHVFGWMGGGGVVWGWRPSPHDGVPMQSAPSCLPMYASIPSWSPPWTYRGQPSRHISTPGPRLVPRPLVRRSRRCGRRSTGSCR
jgi:hypothetical protein